MKKQLASLILRSFAYTLAMLLVYILLNSMLSGSVWNGMTVSKSALTNEYCEFNNASKFFHQSINTYSNLVYFFFGIFICQIGWSDFKNVNPNASNRLETFPLLSLLMGICFIYLSFGSAFFHASLTWAGQRVDMNGTYSISICLLLIGFYCVFYKITFSERQQIQIIFVALLFILCFYQIHLLVSSSVLLPIFILAVWLLIAINFFQFRRERSLILALSSIISIIVALKIRTLDVAKIGCDPYSVYQGHAVWHFLAGLSSFCSYAFFRFKIYFQTKLNNT